MFRDIDKLCVRLGDSVRKAIKHIEDGQCGIVLVVDGDRRLLGTITDGDIRRALLAEQDIDAPVELFLAIKENSPYAHPVTAPIGTAPAELLARMISGVFRQIPLIDGDGRVAALATLQDLLPASTPALGAVIMAGGLGTRLMPLTEDLPKPMLPVGGRPLMEHIIEQLQQAGIRRVHVSTHYKPEKIIEHFGDGQAFGVDLNYVNEDLPLGTGGALGLISPPSETQLVINGDILTQIDFGAMLAFHQDNAASLTMAVRRYELQVPYGVIECDGARVTSLKEKPQVGVLVNAGVYLLEPSVYEFIPRGRSFNMTDLIWWLLDAGRTVISFPIREYWLDVGQHGDYAQAQDDMKNGKVTR
jgi:dTDP-glucose pyrophosphorylase/CBS domain-containing protein